MSKLPPPPANEGLGGLGRRWTADLRDHHLPLLATAITSRSWYVPPPPKDQADTPMCVGYSTAAWLAASPVRNMQFDPVALYHEAQANDEWEGTAYEGTSVRGAMKALTARGLVSSYGWATTSDQVIAYVLEKGPMILGTDWYLDMFTPDRWGYIRARGEVVGGHAYLAVGANSTRDNHDGSRGAIRVQSSWGPNWADSGRAWLTQRDLALLLGNYGEAAIAVEVKK